MTRGFIYILTNSGMPGVVNIGSTGRHPEDRARELSSGDVPTPFDVCYYAWSEDAAHDATHLHEFLFDYRNRDTNFFSMSPQQAIHAVESQLRVKRMFVTDSVEKELRKESTAPSAATGAIESGAEKETVAGTDEIKFSEQDSDATPSPDYSHLSEKERIIQQAKDFEVEQDLESRRIEEQKKLEETIAFELHQERNRQRALKLHEEHQQQQAKQAQAEADRAREREEERLALIKSEKKKRQAEREALEEKDRLEEYERRQRALSKRLSLEKKNLRRRQTAAAIKIVGLFLIVAALLGWFWGTQNSASTSGVSTMIKNLAQPRSG